MADVLILGAGIFGTSTAYHLSKEDPNLSITIVDRHPYPFPNAGSSDAGLGASYDVNKIVRADYSIPFYMDLAHEAIEVWNTWDLIKGYYHRSGWIALGEKGSDLTERIRKNFRACGKEDVTADVKLDEVKNKWNGVLQDMSTEGIGSAYFNPGAGWAEADKAVAAILKECVDLGRVKYCQGEIAEILFASNAQGVKGVKLVSGKILEAKKVVLATGAWTSKIMSPIEDQLGFKDNERVESQVKTAGVVAMHWQLSSDNKQRYDQMPVVIYGERAEIQPPSPSGLLKMVWPDSFTNSIILPSGQKISVPPHPEESQYKVPEKLKEQALNALKQVMPSLLKMDTRLSYWRLCWDAITPAQHQIIAKHPDPRLSNLYLAVGGSFHSWKFLPTIGKYVSNVINGISNGEEKDGQWGWKQHGWQQGGVKGAHEKVIPTAELRDYL